MGDWRACVVGGAAGDAVSRKVQVYMTGTEHNGYLSVECEICHAVLAQGKSILLLYTLDHLLEHAAGHHQHIITAAITTGKP